MIRAAVIAVLMLTAAVTGAVAFDHYRPKQASVVEPIHPQFDEPERKTVSGESRQRHQTKHPKHKPLHVLGKRYPGDDTANELNRRELR